MIFNKNRKSNSSKIRLDIFINNGGGDINQRVLMADRGISILDALKSVVSVEYTPDESVTGHCGAMVTAINGHKNSLRRFWMYYLREESDSGWRLPPETPDAIKLHKNARIAWRYHEAPPNANSRDSLQRYGPLLSSACLSKAKKCNRQF
jgi:hypothetical protein